MLLFTWNLNQKPDALLLALLHLSAVNEPFIACLQELPPAMANTALARQNLHGLVDDGIRCLGVTPAASSHTHGRVALFCSPVFSSRAKNVAFDPRQRMAIISVEGAHVRPLLVIGYHGVSRHEAPEALQRGSIGTQVRGEVDKHWLQGELIMLGDFNANPFDAEVCGSRGLYAVRNRLEAQKKRASPLTPLGKRQQRLLYNPMWSLLPERAGSPEGTFVFDPETMLRWRIYDQILVSPGLAGQIQSPPEILPTVYGRSLLRDDGTPDGGALSDHLPVQLRINL